MAELVRLLPRYLIGFLAIAGYFTLLFFLAGWTWFRAHFNALGIDADASSEGLFSKFEAYVPEGLEAVLGFFAGQFNEEFYVFYNYDILRSSLKYLPIALIAVLLLYFISVLFVDFKQQGTVDDVVGNGTISNAVQPVLFVDMKLQKTELPANKGPLERAFWGAWQVSVFSFLLVAAIIAIKAGQWRGAQTARGISMADLPRIQITFKETTSRTVRVLERQKLRKVFSDTSNIYVYSDIERRANTVNAKGSTLDDLKPSASVRGTGDLPPIYIIPINEISQIWVQKEETLSKGDRLPTPYTAICSRGKTACSLRNAERTKMRYSY